METILNQIKSGELSQSEALRLFYGNRSIPGRVSDIISSVKNQIPPGFEELKVFIQGEGELAFIYDQIPKEVSKFLVLRRSMKHPTDYYYLNTLVEKAVAKELGIYDPEKYTPEGDTNLRIFINIPEMHRRFPETNDYGGFEGYIHIKTLKLIRELRLNDPEELKKYLKSLYKAYLQSSTQEAKSENTKQKRFGEWFRELLLWYQKRDNANPITKKGLEEIEELSQWIESIFTLSNKE